MGDFDPEKDFYTPFRQKLEGVLREQGNVLDQIVRIHPIDYSDVALDAKKAVFKRAFPQFGIPPKWWQVIGLLRYFMTFFIGDVVIYASSEGENLIRDKVFHDIDTIIQEDAATFSIVAHSLGSVIAYDYLYNVFGKNEAERRRVRDDGKQQLRHFFTMGSPIGFFLLRRTDLLDEQKRSLLPNPIGLSETGHWYNFYDKEDIIAYPLKNFFPTIVEDVQVQTGDLVYNSHMDYWKDEEVAAKIADCLMA